METQRQTGPNLLFRLKAKDPNVRIEGAVVGKGRFLIGRSESCDVIVPSDAVSAVHAVLEITGGRARLYDMNSTNGTWVGGKKVVTADLSPGESFSIGDVDLSLFAYQPEEALPPVLDALEPAHGEASVMAPPEVPPGAKEAKRPPSAPTVASQDANFVLYPLALDPRADNSEYIFEDVETLYPIFKYEHAKQAVEVIILFRDRVFSVDYLPARDGSYGLAGFRPGAGELEFPHLGKSERLPFVDVRGGVVEVHKLPGYEILHLSDQQPKAVNQGTGVIKLLPQDILRFHNSQLQILVRNVEAPPKVAVPPLFRRDPEMRRYLWSFLLFTLVFSAATQFITFDDAEVEQAKEEKAPERIATILYRQKLAVSKPTPVDKTPDTPKQPQKSPNKVPVPKEVQVKPAEKPAVKNAQRTDEKPQGSKTARETRPVRKGNPGSKDTRPAKAGGPAAGAKMPSVKAGTSSAAFEGVKTSGPVEVYKSADFSSNVSALVAKGGTAAKFEGVKVAGGEGGSNQFGSGVATGQGSGSELTKATVTTSMGSLTGVANGALGTTSKGAEGLSAKTTIYTAGIPSETVVLGSMDPDVIRRILMDNLPKFRFCYQSELERSGKELQDVIKLDFVIGASGHVTQAGADGGSSLPGQVRRCVVDVLKGIQFPQPLGGGTVEVKQPMNFYPKRL